MGALSVVQTIWTTQMPVLGQSAWLDVADGRLIIHDPAWQRAELPLQPGLLSPQSARYVTVSPASARRPLVLDRQDRQIDSATVDRLTQGDDSATTHLDGSGFAGNLAALHRTTVNGKDFLYVAASSGQGVSTYRVGTDGGLTLVRAIGDSQTRYLDGVTAMDSAWIGERRLMVTISARENGVSVFELTGGGQLNPIGSFGLAEQLPVDRPAALELVEQDGRVFALLAAFGSASLTVLELRADGTLGFMDQVIDNRETRFAGATAMDTITVDGQVLIAVAGQDGGLSLFQMLPGGRLVHRETLVDTADTALDGIRQLHFAQVGERIELFALSTRDAGLTRIALDIGPAGQIGEQTWGSDDNDVLTAPDGGRHLRAGAGDDILIDGDGADRLQGGTGADLFVLRPDGLADTIGDFNLEEDRIDLSGFALLHAPDDLTITRTQGGAVLRWEAETLHVMRDTGGAITAADLGHRVLFNSSHVIMPDPLPVTGDAGNDTFLWSNRPDTIDGGGGYDTMVYSAAPLRAWVDLTDNSRNAYAAEGDVLRNIEALIGTSGADLFTGDAAANALSGLRGRDTLLGGAGNDWITPGPGADLVEGGSGSDMVSYNDLATTVRINLALEEAVSAGETDTLTGIENATGSIYADLIQGSAAANRLRGLGGYDWFTGTAGNDRYEGGSGRDMVSYVASSAAVTVDLGQGRGLAGLAAGDSYDSIERVTGSIHADLLYGNSAENDLRGLGGYDWFIGSGGGRDRYDGGTGTDTVAYSASTSGVRASLLLGYGSAGDAARDLFTSIESLTGSNQDDILTGDHGRNRLRGMYGQDTLYGNGGVDRLEGGGSDDFLDGGSGWDVALFSGNRSDYTVTTLGRYTVVERIAPGGDGTDTLLNMEALQFADQLLYL
jgi:Ca2+-binding RTX toxin-like protein